MPLPRLAVVGVGLIGGSFSLALKRAGAVAEVVGLGRAPLDEALRLGVIDRAAANIRDAVTAADVVLLATPVGQMPQLFAAIRDVLPPGCLITDAGSTKQDVIGAAKAGLGERVSQFVPAHPVAGREKSGVAAAEPALFEGRHVVLTPSADQRAEDVDRIAALWRACGARVSTMTPTQHDAVFAAVSHLPHMLAYALVDDIAARPNADELFAFAAGGFRDFTRIASSSPEMWRDIALNNREALLCEIDSYGDKLAALRALVAAGDGPGLERLMARARDRRDAWLARFNVGAENTAE
ncbi:MAG: prephenate dehydrogenase/arogenate dehydrogenase family protein [Betaproteobacteria bacterium]|nr:prephenate dehydrogenase/arogenate dehydrogenase family protein [Betaproteobacteria bacterium]